MEHVLSRPRSPWRIAALVAAGVAAAELVVLVAFGLPALGREAIGALESKAVKPAAAPAPRPAPKERSAVPVLPRTDTSVLVLNGNGVPGAASSAGGRLHGLGYIVAGVGNAPRLDYARTIVMYRPGRETEGRRLARDLGARVVGPLDGLSVRELMGAQVVLVLGGR